MLKSIRNRFPPRFDILPVFALIVFIVNSWSIVWFLHKLPSWLLFLDTGGILSILAYSLALALLESGVFLLGIVAVSVLTPIKFLRTGFVSKSSAIVFLATFWAIVFQIPRSRLHSWSLEQLQFRLGMAFVSMIIACVLVHRTPRVQEALRSFAERLIVFLYVYVPLGLFSCIVVVIRNLLVVP